MRRLVEMILPSPAVGGTQIVPVASVAGRALTAVVAIMSFLACLTAGAVYLINQSASAWFQDIAAEVTVQVSPLEGVDIESHVTKVALFLAKQRGIARVRPISVKETGVMLEPWLGTSDALKALPIPRLIAVEIDRASPPDLTLVATGLKRQFRGVSLDNHSQWQAQIRTVTRSLALGGLAVLFLVAFATVAVIISATRSAMASNREIVEVLHFVGAKQKFIAREFERHFLVLGIRAGLMGFAATAVTFMILPFVMRLLGGSSITAAELRRFVGSASLDLAGHVTLFGVVIGVAAICMFTSRYWVDRILNHGESSVMRSGSRTALFGVFSAGRKGRISAGGQGSALGAAQVGTTGERRAMKHISQGAGLLLKASAIAAILFVGGFLWFAYSLKTGQQIPRADADGIVVLTGGKARISEAVKLLAAGKAQRLLISGVNAQVTRKELIRLSPASKPLFDCCIDIGRQAQNTIGNADETRKWSQGRGFKSLIVVTSTYHMPRALAELRRAMPGAAFVPYSVVPKSLRIRSWWAHPEVARLVFFEYLKYLPTLARLGSSRLMSAIGPENVSQAGT